MKTVPFALVDAFTTIPLCGNPAGVVVDAGPLEAEQRVAIAREVGASETIFLDRLGDGDGPVTKYRSRFFSRRCEIDLCGHATIAGFHHVAGLDHELAADERLVLTQETRVGDLPVEIAGCEDGGVKVTMDQSAPEFEDVDLSPDKLAAMFGIAKKQIDDGLPIEIVSTGIRSLHIPIKSLSHFPDVKPLRKNLIELCHQESIRSVQLFTLETKHEGSHVHARVFAPSVGIDEDPVTGTASGALGAYLIRHGRMRSEDGASRIVVEQGEELGRAGRVEVIVEHEGDEIDRVRVSGRAVTVLEGELRIA